jgi:hypothetical protein
MSPGQSLLSAILTLSLWSSCVCASFEEQAAGFTIQVAAFPESAESEAEKFVSKLTESGEQPIWGLIEIPGKGQWMRVFIGAFESSAEARQYGEKLMLRRIIKEFVIKKSSEIKMLSRPRSVGRKAGKAVPVGGTTVAAEEPYSASGRLEKSARIPEPNPAKPPPEKLRPPLESTRPPTGSGSARLSQALRYQNSPHPNHPLVQTLYRPNLTSQAVLLKASKEGLIDIRGVARSRFPLATKSQTVSSLRRSAGRNSALKTTATLATLKTAESLPQVTTGRNALIRLAPPADLQAMALIDPLKLAFLLIASLSAEKSLSPADGGLWLSGDREEGLARLQWIVGKDCATLIRVDSEGRVRLNGPQLAKLAGMQAAEPALASLQLFDFISANEGLLLLVQLTQGGNRYLLHLGRQAPTAAGEVLVNGSLNLDNNFDSRINPYRRLHRKMDIEKPPVGFDSLIAINPEARWFNLPTNRWVQVGNITFHELVEAHAKIALGLDYLPVKGLQGAHNIAIERELRLKEQRPSANLVVTVGSNRMLKSEEELRQFYAETNAARQQ